jgi:hypothetical protein
LIKGEANVIDRARYREMDETIAQQVERVIGLPVTRSGQHGWSKSLIVVPPGESPIGRRNELPRTRFQFYAGVEDQIEVVEGHFPRPTTDPQDVVEVMITEALAEELGLQAGDLFHVEDFTGGAQPMQVQVRLAAVIRLRDPGSAFWFYAPWFLDEAFTVPEETFFNSIALGTALGAGAGWMFTRFLQVSIIARESVPPFLIVTPWSTIFQLYIILVIVFLAALTVSVYLLRRMRINAVLRLGEQ